jgi:hypothetical protein
LRARAHQPLSAVRARVIWQTMVKCTPVASR